MERWTRGSATCAAVAGLWVLVLVAAYVVDGGRRLPAALLLLAGFVVGWVVAWLAAAPGPRAPHWPRGVGRRSFDDGSRG